MTPIDLKARARQAMIQSGFQPDFPAEVIQETSAPRKNPPTNPGSPVRDLRPLLWSSIDNKDSRDLDQIEYLEKLADGSYRLLVGIADVDADAPKNSATDQHAAANATTVYTGITIFPMLPEALSTDRTSLLNDNDRRAMVVELRIQPSGETVCHDAYPALVRNRAKLAYISVGAWLAGQGPIPPAIAAVPGMEAQIRLQRELTGVLRELRKRLGALVFSSNDVTPVIDGEHVTALLAPQQNIAEDIIESFMVAANVAMAQHLKDKGWPCLRRVVKTPKRWDRIVAIAGGLGTKLPSSPDPKSLSDFLDHQRQADPDHFPDLSLAVIKLLGPGIYIVESPGKEHEGHFGLALQDYTHSTAPNRRYADLATQRLIKAMAGGAGVPYAEAELTQIADHCTEREDAARKVERFMQKLAACDLMQKRIGEMFDGIITGASPKGTFVRLLKVPVEGMIVQGASGLDVGDKARVKLVGVDASRAFIDFAKA